MCKDQDFKKILRLYEKNKIYDEFNKLVSVLEKKMFYLTPIVKEMSKVKRIEKTSYDQNEINKIKCCVPQKFSEELKKILSFLTQD